MTVEQASSNKNGARASHAARDAAYWLATLSDESCTEAERQQFSQWLRESTRNVDEFLRLSMLTRTVSKRDLWPELSVEELVAAARASTVTALDSTESVDVLRPEPAAQRWKIAASIALATAALGFATFAALRTTQLFDPTYRTALGEQRSITLEDGSVVQLNSSSSLRTHLTAELRAVELTDGEAIFRVAKDPQRPFRVRTGATDIVAVGTAFNVNANEARTIVTVIEGRIRVNQRSEASPAPAGAANKDVELGVGEQLIVAPARPMVRLALGDTEKVTSWTERRLIFDETSIAAAAAEFARYSPRQIRVQDAHIGARKISGVFDATDPGSLIEFLRADATVEVVAGPDGWVVRSRD